MTDAHFIRVKSSVDALPISDERKLSPDLVGSWRRCINDYGLDPRDRHETVVLDSGAIKERRESVGGIFDLLVHESRSIYNQIRDSGSSVVVCDAQGVVLSWVGDIDQETDFRKSGLLEGALWDEAHEGTNGIGTCIAHKKPVLIHREDHFLERNISMCCTGMPICNANGDVLAVLDITSTNPNETRSSQIYSLAFLKVSARKVEQWVFRQNYANYTLLRINKRPELVGTFEDTMLALDVDGIIQGIENPSILEMVGYSSKDLIGKPYVRFFTLLPTAGIGRVANIQMIELKSTAPKDMVLFALIDSNDHAKTNQSYHSNVPAEKLKEKSVRKVPTFKVNNKLLNKDAEFNRLTTAAVSLLKQGVPVLVAGETGSGKNYVALALHQHANPDGDFIEINMDKPIKQITEVLDNRFERNNVNYNDAVVPTFFFDDIEQLTTRQQTSLAKTIIQIERINAKLEHQIKIISSCSCVWQIGHGGVGNGKFRKDLYFRLAGFVLPLSPLKSRKDKVYIFNTFLAEAAGKHKVKLDAEVVKIFKEYDWPGNYWELKNVIAAAMTQIQNETIKISDLPPIFQGQLLNGYTTVSDSPQYHNKSLNEGLNKEVEKVSGHGRRSVDETPLKDKVSGLRNNVKNAERILIIESLEKNFWNISQTAKDLAISRKTLYRKMDALQIPHG